MNNMWMESIRLAQDRISEFWGGLAAVWGILGVVCTFGDYPWVYLGVLISCIVASFGYVVFIFARLRSPVVDIKMAAKPNRHFMILKDGYCENAKKLLTDVDFHRKLRKKNISSHRICFAIGIDRTCDIFWLHQKVFLEHSKSI